MLRFLSWFSPKHRDQRDQELQRELGSHIEAEAEEQIARGTSPDQARRAARVQFGNVTLAAENTRETWGWATLDRFVHDIHFGLRILRKERAFTLLAITALALGIGATTVIFSVIDNVILEPFPYRDAGRLTKFYIHDPAHPEQTGRADFLMPEYRAFKEQNRVFEDVIATVGADILYSDPQGAKLFAGYQTTANTFDFLGVPPLLGRAMVPDDGRPNAPPVAVMSYRAWKREFGGDPNIIGKLLTLNGQPTAVIAVMPPRFQLYDGDFWLPLTSELPDMRAATLGRLKRGVDLKQVSADLEPVSRELARIYPGSYPREFSVITISLVDRVVRRFKPLLFALMAAVTMLLLIACSNVANLLLARATIREHEIAVRASLGASRRRLLMQLTVESFLLAALGGIAGCGLAYAGIRLVRAAMPRDLIPNESVIALNSRVLLFAVALAFVTTMLSGLAPALHAIGRDLHERVKAVGKGVSQRAHRGGLRTALVISQVTLSIVLLTGAGLMMRSLLAIEHVDLGFNPDHVLIVVTSFPKGGYTIPVKKHVFFRSVLERISALPGIDAAAVASAIPPHIGLRSDLTVLGGQSGQAVRSALELCSETYFQALGIPLLRGRLFNQTDVEGARHVAVVNQTLARAALGNDDALGRSVKFNWFDSAPESPKDTYFEIVGIVRDEKNDGLEQPPQPEAFLPYTVSGALGRGIVVRTAIEPRSALPMIQREIWAVDPAVAPTLARDFNELLEQNFYSQPRFAMLVLGLFAAIGLLLAAIGIFSVMAYLVSQQTREIGIRMALGAQRGTVMRTVLARGVVTTLVGIGLGELVSLLMTRLLQNQLWGVSPRDPVTLAAVLVVLLAVGLAACLVPAQRATRVDPMIALRYE